MTSRPSSQNSPRRGLLAFDVAAYFRKQGREIAFLTKVVVEFQVLDRDRHYHVPLLLSRYSCSSYRGS